MTGVCIMHTLFDRTTCTHQSLQIHHDAVTTKDPRRMKGKNEKFRFSSCAIGIKRKFVPSRSTPPQTMLYFLQRFPPFPTFKNCYSVHFSRALSSNPGPPCNFTNLSVLLQGHIPRSRLLQVHARVFRINAHQDNLVATRLIGQYPSHFALRVFHQLQKPNLFPFNSIIRVLSEEGLFSDSFLIFKILKRCSLSPNDFTFSFLLKACLRSGNACFVKQVHTHVVKMGFTCDSFVCNGLLLVYAKGLEDLVSGRKVFDEMPDKGMVCSWTSLIGGCAQSGQSEEALDLFVMMIEENLKPEDDTMVSVLSACSNLEIVEIEKWVRILSEYIHYKQTNFYLNPVNTILVYLYGKLGKIDKSRERFEEIVGSGKRSVLPWNVMINAYVQNGFPLEAINLFRMMVEYPNLKPNHVTMVGVLSACAQIGDLDLGRWVHNYIKFNGCKCNTNLATALIDMYSKCGSLEKAKEVFHHMVSIDVVTFNAMIMGLAVNGEGEEALRLFSKMQEIGLHPNAATFLGVLCACSHSGLLEEGRSVFLDMSVRFSVPPKLEHYACYIDLLARGGLVEKALEVASSMPFEPNNFVWGALLGGCLLHSKVELAQDLSQRLVGVDPENSAGYVMMSNALAVDRRWGEVSGLRWFMKEKGVRKQPGHSWIRVDGIVHEFLAGCPSHPQIENIYHTLDRLVKEMKVACPWKVQSSI